MRALACLLAAALAAPTAAAELVMLERPGCVWCARWNAEIAPIWPNTAEGARAPLRRVDLTEPWPADLSGVARDVVTPTFVVVEDGREVGRLRGYPGEDFFWPLIGEIVGRLDAPAGKAPGG